MTVILLNYSKAENNQNVAYTVIKPTRNGFPVPLMCRNIALYLFKGLSFQYCEHHA